MPKTLTVFTPTYNRAYILPKLYESLKEQTSQDFCWLVVDDGSTDNTEELINAYKAENLVDITYLKQPNGGKQRAHNTGVKNAQTELFVCVDSDDHLVADAVESLISKWQEVKANNVVGIVGYRGKNQNETLSGEFTIHGQCTLQKLYNSGFKGDTTLMYKTEVLKAHLFPEIEGEKFITENYVYYQIDKIGELEVFEKILVIAEYLEDGYTKSKYKLHAKNPLGYIMYYNMLIGDTKSLAKKFKYSVALADVMFLGKVKGKFKKAKNKFMLFWAMPLGYLVYLKRRKDAK